MNISSVEDAKIKAQECFMISQSHPEKAKLIAQDVYDYAKKMNNVRLQSDFLPLLLSFSHLNRSPKALEINLIYDGLYLIEQDISQTRKIQILSCIGNIYQASMMTSEALQYHIKACSLVEQDKDTQSTTAFLNVAHLYSEIGDILNTWKYLMKQLDAILSLEKYFSDENSTDSKSHKHFDNISTCQTYYMIGKFFFDIGELLLARNAIEYSLEFCTDESLIVHRCFSELLLAEIFYSTQSYTDGQTLLDKLSANIEILQNELLTIQFYIISSKYCISLHQTTEAIWYAKKALYKGKHSHDCIVKIEVFLHFLESTYSLSQSSSYSPEFIHSIFDELNTLLHKVQNIQLLERYYYLLFRCYSLENEYVKALYYSNLYIEIVNQREKNIAISKYTINIEIERHRRLNILTNIFSKNLQNEVYTESERNNNYLTSLTMANTANQYSEKKWRYNQPVINKTNSDLHREDMMYNTTSKEELACKASEEEFQVTMSIIVQLFPLLTHKEIKICSLIIHSYSPRTIIETLKISLHTFYTHRKNIRKKLKLPANYPLESFLAHHIAVFERNKVNTHTWPT